MQTENYLLFDITYHNDLKYFVPTLYINSQNNFSYTEKKATLEVLTSFGINMNEWDKNLVTLFNTIQFLKPEELQKRFNKKAKKGTHFLEDKTLSNYFYAYTDEKLAIVLKLVFQHKIPISLNLGNGKEFYKFQIDSNPITLSTKLLFKKNKDGIDYNLNLWENDRKFQITNEIIFITNQPGIIIQNKKIYFLEIINSKKLTPFLTKEFIHIPPKMVGTYFDTFIKDIVKKVDIHAEGFQLKKVNKISSCHLSIFKDYLTEKHLVELHYCYDNYSFSSSSAKKIASDIAVENNEFSVIQYIRNPEEENNLESVLESIDLVKNINGFFEHESSNTYEIFHLIERHKKLLEKNKIEVKTTTSDKKSIVLAVPKIKQSIAEKNDWFDIDMKIDINKVMIPFSSIINHIRKNEPLFEYQKGSYFIIPEEWFSTYSSLAKLSKVSITGKLELPKSNISVLNQLPSFLKKEKKEIHYNTSPNLNATLRPYQIDGVKWLIEHQMNGLGACLADDMGLGKTLQTLALLTFTYDNLEEEKNESTQVLDLFSELKQKEKLKALIILPSSLIFNWYEEIKKFTPHFQILKYQGNDRKKYEKKINLYDVILTSYNILNKDIDLFQKENFNYVILDESQYIKNKDSKIFKNLNKLTTQNRISLSGTPIENSLSDLWAQMQFINPNILGDYNFFNNHFKIPIEKKKDEIVLAELKHIIDPFILRRTKEQVLNDLPELSEQIIYCELLEEEQTIYEEEKSKARNALLHVNGEKADTILVLNTLMKLRQHSNHQRLLDKESKIESGKFLEVSSYIDTIVKSGQKALIFSSFIEHLNLYMQWCKEQKINYVSLTGKTKTEERGQIVNQYQNNSDIKIFFISLKAGGVGLNLTKASYVLFLDPWWNPQVERQALSRAHRIGQENKVNVVRFISKDTIEEKIINLQKFKKELADNVIDQEIIPIDIEDNISAILE